MPADATKARPMTRQTTYRYTLFVAVDQLGRDLKVYQADVLAGRYRLDPGRKRDQEGELREKALALRDMLERCPALEAPGRTVVRQLERIMTGRVAGLDPDLGGPLEEAARAKLPTLKTRILQRLAALAEQMQELHRAVRSRIEGTSEVQILAECMRKLEANREAFKLGFVPDDRIRKMLVDNRCELCP